MVCCVNCEDLGVHVRAEHDPVCLVLGKWYCFQVFYDLAKLRSVKHKASPVSPSGPGLQPDVVDANLNRQAFLRFHG